MPARTIVWVRFRDLKRMLFNYTFTGLMMQMAVMQEIDMVPMLDCSMAALGSVNMAMVVVGMAHLFVPRLKFFTEWSRTYCPKIALRDSCDPLGCKTWNHPA
jgi:hypothetical protein